MRLLIVVLCLIAPEYAYAHCYKRWYYPWPQNCGYSHSYSRSSVRYQRHYAIPTTPYIPIPDMTATWEATVSRELYEGMQRKRALILLGGQP